MKLLLTVILLSAVPIFAAEPSFTAAEAINELGVDLLRQVAKPGANALLSPYSIQSALALTCAGAEGATRTEMAQVLHYPKDETEVHRSFAALRRSLDEITQNSTREAERLQQPGGKMNPITLTTANRLFGQSGYAFRESFLSFVKENHDAPFAPLDFSKNASAATQQINQWVAEQTQLHIRNLIPAGALDELTRLVLVNAIYLKAPWADKFSESATKPQVFHLGANHLASVPTMMSRRTVGYARRDGCTLLTIPYRGGELQFLILLPDPVDGPSSLEKKLTAKELADAARLDSQEVILYLPKFKLEPPGMALSRELQALGMKSAFDLPRGGANFDRIAPRRGTDYLYISEVFHKAFLELDEEGTEAAAATAVVMAVRSAVVEKKPKPIEVRVDRPFLFAVQHRASGACLFLGHVSDPR